MSTSSPPKLANGTLTLSSPAVKTTTSPPSKASSTSKSDWLTASIVTAKVIAETAECVPFPYVQAVFKAVVALLENVEQMKQNQHRLKELCNTTLEIITIIQAQISRHGNPAASSFKESCEGCESILQEVLDTVLGIRLKRRGWLARLKEFFKSRSIADDIAGYQSKIEGLRVNFMFDATLGIGFGVEELLAKFAPAAVAVSFPKKINTCPPPSRIFQGRQMILEKMKQYFFSDSGNQNIFLLHGLGGAGKTQTALKFIADSSSHFSDIFMVDMSSIETIESGLKNIAATTNIGKTSQDALQWLTSKADAWLLFLDNADDPKINLNNFFPKCNHGNIVITSRNPGLRVYAGAHSLVSDMDEADAVKLLLKSASEEPTDTNTGIAVKIVKALFYMPLAIIQAGAFISQSGALENYLELYATNRTRLLSEKPAQSHDDYAWTVYTTWQISFDQLSLPAATLLQLCAFLHHQGIFEEIFSYASGYQCYEGGPSKEELQHPFEFLSQFGGPTGAWDSLRFMDITNEIKAYSLINFDAEHRIFSFHPLVHHWAQSVVSEPETWHNIYAILGMAIATMTDSDKPAEVISLKFLAHVDSISHEEYPPKYDFRAQFGTVYNYAGRSKDALSLYLGVLDKQKQIFGAEHTITLKVMKDLALTHIKLRQFEEAEELTRTELEIQRRIKGDDHLGTLIAMANLAAILGERKQFKQAEQLYSVVLEKQKHILGYDHLGTITVMSNLAQTYRNLGRFEEARKLQIVVFEKRKKILGDDHPDTLHDMNHLALTYRELVQFTEAEKLQLVAVDKFRNILGDDHPDTLLSMSCLAQTYFDLGKLQEAEELGVVVLEKRRNILGDDHPDTLVTMGNLAHTYRSLSQINHNAEQFEKSVDLQVTVFENRAKVLGLEHPDTLVAMWHLALTYAILHQFEETQVLLGMMLETRWKTLGANHPETRDVIQALANTYTSMGKTGEAENLKLLLEGSQT
ncbi:hypothetical protein C8R43DRAFT_933933 [Mycena crocata]|nr:hypothetical protein C8R43DRAFT_933933 [Mycena crocata]